MSEFIDHREVSDLMDCPFCGARPSLHPVGNSYSKSRKLTVKCTGCRVQVTNAAIRHDFDWLRKVTVEAWNRRAARCNDTAPVAPIGDEQILAFADKHRIAYDGDYSRNGFEMKQDIIGFARALLEAVAAQGAK